MRCAKTGVYKIGHHDLRHLFTTRAIEAQIPIPTVARWLGHKDGGALLMRTYSHLLDAHSKAMAQRMTFWALGQIPFSNSEKDPQWPGLAVTPKIGPISWNTAIPRRRSPLKVP
jgi:hypothetical protein